MITHTQTPQKYEGEINQAVFGQLRESKYYKHIQKLTPIVKDKVVKSSLAGNSGFILYFDDNSSIITFIDHSKLSYKHIEKEPLKEDIALIHSYEYGNAFEALNIEIINAHAQKIQGLSIGRDCFNFCFSKGMELETMLIPDENEKLLLRVFWEKW